MFGIVLKLFAIAGGATLAVWAAATALRSSRQLDRRIKEFKAEQEERERTGRPIDPYSEFADLGLLRDARREKRR
jgi:hypothetical protein